MDASSLYSKFCHDYSEIQYMCHCNSQIKNNATLTVEEPVLFFKFAIGFSKITFFCFDFEP